MKLGDFLNKLAQKSNMQTDANLINFLSNAEIAGREISDDFANALDNSLMSLEGAKNNQQLLNHFKPILLKSADDKFAVLAEKYGFADEILLEKSTYKKFDILEAKIEAKLKEVNSATDKEKEAKLLKQYEDLQSQLQKLTETKANEIKAITDKYEGEITNMHFNSLLSGKKYATKDLPAEVNTQIARQLIERALQANKATIVRKDGTLKLVQTDNPEMDYVDSGFNKVSFSDFADKVLAENKLLEVSQQSQQTQTQHQTQQTQTQQTVNTSKFDAAFNASQSAIQTN